MLDLTVIIVTYNRGRVLLDTLDSILLQRPSPLEILVIDQTAAQPVEIQQQIQQWQSDDRIRYLRQQPPHAQIARNRAIKEAKGSVLLFLDDDVILEPGMLAAHMKNYVDTSIAAVCGFYTEPGEQARDDLPATCKRPWTGWIHFSHCYSRRVECHLFPSCNGSIRRDVIRQLGGFDENFTHTLLDDTDLACRLRSHGFRAIHDPDARLHHLKATAGGKRPTSQCQFVIADADRWYTWWYFYLINFGLLGLPELALYFRRCVLRRSNLTRPRYLVAALRECIRGGMRAFGAILHGRRLVVFED